MTTRESVVPLMKEILAGYMRDKPVHVGDGQTVIKTEQGNIHVNNLSKDGAYLFLEYDKDGELRITVTSSDHSDIDTILYLRLTDGV